MIFSLLLVSQYNSRMLWGLTDPCPLDFAVIGRGMGVGLQIGDLQKCSQFAGTLPSKEDEKEDKKKKKTQKKESL